MKALVELYIQQFKTTLAMMFQYRASLLIWMIGQVLEPLVYLIVWSVVSENSGGSVGSYTTSDFAAYFILLMLVNQVTYTWIMYEFEYRVREGILSFALLKPVHPIHSDIADNVSSKLITLPIMIAHRRRTGVGLPCLHFSGAVGYRHIHPGTAARFSGPVPPGMDSCTGGVLDHARRRHQSDLFVLMLFLSGQIAPLTLLPHPVQIIATILPFRWLISFPVELLLGRLTLAQALMGLGAQAAWLIVSLVLVRIIWRAGVRNYSAVGA